MYYFIIIFCKVSFDYWFNIRICFDDWEFWRFEVLGRMDVLVKLIHVAFAGHCGFWEIFWIRLTVRLGQFANCPAMMALRENVEMKGLDAAL